MKNKDLILGALLSVLSTFVGSWLWITFLTDFDYIAGIRFYAQQDMLGKIITLGAILNIFLFYFLLRKDRDELARGVILGLIILTLITLFL